MIKGRTDRAKPLIVIDSNVWISSLVFGGVPGELLQLFISGDVIVVVSEELLSELRRNITRKFPGFAPSLELLAESIKKDAIMVRLGAHHLRQSRDSDDDKIIETAIIGGCSMIVSGDQDLLTLKSSYGIQIVTPAEFINRWASKQN